MKYPNVVLLLCVSLCLLTSCTQISIAEEERLRSTTTATAETVVPVAVAPTGVAEATAAPTTLPTAGPTAAPTALPSPTPLALPPTPTPDAALNGFSLCDQVAGDPAGGRFSAKITTITSTVETKFERLEIGLQVPDSSVAPHASARCLSQADDTQLVGAAGGYTLLIGLDGWLHDDLFRASTVTSTLKLSGTTTVSAASLRVTPNAAAGASIALTLKDALPFRVTLEQKPTRLVIEVAKTSPITPSNDLLTQANGTVSAAAPLYYIQDGDIFSFSGGKAANLTKSAEIETAFSVSNATKQIAFCRSEAGASVGDALAASSLWLIGTDGSNPRELAAPGRTCADPAFSPDSKTIALTVDEGSSTPPRLSIYTVNAESGQATRLTQPGDAWSRFGPQWLDGGRIVYAAQSEDSRNTLFISNQGSEEDVGAALTLGSAYSGFGRPLAAPDGKAIAVEGLRADGSGANLLLLDTNGAKQNEITGGYWVRPVAWSEQGSLFYLATACASSVAQSYTLFALAPSQQKPSELAYGITTGGFGAFAASGNTLAYVSQSRVAPGPRGPAAASVVAPGAVWALDLTNGSRSKLLDAANGIGAVVAP